MSGGGTSPLTCDGGWSCCNGHVTHIGSKGYAYCSPCAGVRRGSGAGERVRLLKPDELQELLAGRPLARY